MKNASRHSHSRSDLFLAQQQDTAHGFHRNFFKLLLITQTFMTACIPNTSLRAWDAAIKWTSQSHGRRPNDSFERQPHDLLVYWIKPSESSREGLGLRERQQRAVYVQPRGPYLSRSTHTPIYALRICKVHAVTFPASNMPLCGIFVLLAMKALFPSLHVLLTAVATPS